MRKPQQWRCIPTNTRMDGALDVVSRPPGTFFLNSWARDVGLLMSFIIRLRVWNPRWQCCMSMTATQWWGHGFGFYWVRGEVIPSRLAHQRQLTSGLQPRGIYQTPKHFLASFLIGLFLWNCYFISTFHSLIMFFHHFIFTSSFLLTFEVLFVFGNNFSLKWIY